MVKSYFILFAVLLSLCSCNRGNSYSTADDTGTVTLSTLLQEIGNHEADPCFPVPYYRAKQLTSYDRRSLLPGKWLNAIDKSLTIRDEELYYIPFLPALYLLDSKKIVIFRNCSLQELEFYFKNRDR